MAGFNPLASKPLASLGVAEAGGDEVQAEFTSVGSISLLKNVTKFVNISSTNSVTLKRNISKNFNFNSIGIITIRKNIAKFLEYTNESIPSILVGTGLLVTVPIVALGTVSITKSIDKILSNVSTGLVNVLKNVNKSFQITAESLPSAVQQIGAPFELDYVSLAQIDFLKFVNYQSFLQSVSVSLITLQRNITLAFSVISTSIINTIAAVPVVVSGSVRRGAKFLGTFFGRGSL